METSWFLVSFPAIVVVRSNINSGRIDQVILFPDKLDACISTTGDDPDDDDWAVTVSHRWHKLFFWQQWLLPLWLRWWWWCCYKLWLITIMVMRMTGMRVIIVLITMITAILQVSCGRGPTKYDSSQRPPPVAEQDCCKGILLHHLFLLLLSSIIIIIILILILSLWFSSSYW